MAASRTPLSVIILAAGKGTRMKSALPKVLHPIAGTPMIAHVMKAVRALDPEEIVLVLAPEMDAVAKAAPAKVAIQAEQKGTGHAVLCAKEALSSAKGRVVIAYGDTPLMTSATLKQLAASEAPVTLLALDLPNPTGYGRLVQAADGNVARIVEEKDASADEKRITLCNAGVMAVDGEVLWEMLEKLSPNNAGGEYYLTDIVALAATAGHRVGMIIGSKEEAMGVNSRVEQAAAEAVMQQRLREKAMLEGVTLIAPETVFLTAETSFGRDVIIHPFVTFAGAVRVGDGVEIKSFSHIDNATIGARCIVGPYARLRPEATLEAGVHIGNFVEVKKSTVREGAKINHLTYVGDADVGAGANIGAGTITCNYDGVNKHKTTIGAGAFIGSNSSLVAPVEIGAGAVIGAGSVITKNVPAEALAFERGQQTTKQDYKRKAKK